MGDPENLGAKIALWNFKLHYFRDFNVIGKQNERYGFFCETSSDHFNNFIREAQS